MERELSENDAENNCGIKLESSDGLGDVVVIKAEPVGKDPFP